MSCLKFCLLVFRASIAEYSLGPGWLLTLLGGTKFQKNEKREEKLSGCKLVGPTNISMEKYTNLGNVNK